MNQDLQKFIDLLKTDKSLQEKMAAAAKNYTGEQKPEAAFQYVILPIAEEAGCHFTWEDYQQYMQVAVKELDPDEMEQVAGGDKTRGTSLSACVGVGVGGGVTVRVKEDGSCSLGTICFFLGFGDTTACAYAGASTDIDKDLDHGWHDCTTSGV